MQTGKIFKHVVALNLVIFFVLIGFEKVTVTAQIVRWANSTPIITHGASSITFSLSVDKPGTVYYVIYNSKPTTISTAKIKTDALGLVTSSVARNGKVVLTQPSAVSEVQQTRLADNKQYHIYLIAEDNAMVLQDASQIKSFVVNLPKRQIEASFNSRLIPGAVVGYNAYVPEDYYKSVNKNFPLLLYLHGNGEKSYPETVVGDLAKARIYGPPMLIDRGEEFPFVVITPQCSIDDWDSYNSPSGKKTYNGKFIDEIIETIKSKYAIDPSRIYLTGSSMGGAGVFTYLLNFPEKIAAAIPIAGWADPSLACRLTDVAIWGFHNQYDPVVGVGSHINTIANINTCIPQARNKAKLTLYTMGGHDSWTATYNNTGEGIAPDNIYNWLTRQVKGNVAENGLNKTPLAYAGKDHFYLNAPSNLILNGSATDIDGSIVSYQWSLIGRTRDGAAQPATQVVLGGANTANLMPANLTQGEYLFRLTVTDNQLRTAFDEVLVSIGIVNAVEKKEIELPVIFQNPVKNELCFAGILDFETAAHISVINTQGVQCLGMQAEELGANACLDVRNLHPGIYFLNIHREGVKFKKVKFIKE